MFQVEKVSCWSAWDKAPATSVEQPHPPSDLHKERENLMLGRESPRTLFHAPLEVHVQCVLTSLSLFLVEFFIKPDIFSLRHNHSNGANKLAKNRFY